MNISQYSLPLVCQRKKYYCISRNLSTLKQEHQPSRAITGVSYQVAAPSYLFVSTRTRDWVANRIKQTFQSVLQQRPLCFCTEVQELWHRQLLCTSMPATVTQGRRDPPCRSLGATPQTPTKSTADSSPNTKLLPDHPTQGPQKPPTNQAHRVHILDINFSEVQVCRVRSNPTQRNIYFVSKLKSHCSELH